MVISKQIQHAAIAVLAAALALIGAHVHAQSTEQSADPYLADAPSAQGPSVDYFYITGTADYVSVDQTSADDTIEQVIVERPRIAGARLQIDNDLFVGRELDRDYTGGFGV